jgi:hypothetical protein
LGGFGADDAGFGLWGGVLEGLFLDRGREGREGRGGRGVRRGEGQLWRLFGLARGFRCRFLGSGCRRIWIDWLRRRGGGMRLSMQLGSGDVLELSELEYH